MTLPFSRSERSLQKDDYRTPAILSLLTLPLFLLGLIWFFMGDLPVEKVSEALTVGAQGTVVATFQLDAPLELERGDSVQLQLQKSSDANATPASAIVTDIQKRRDGKYDVVLLPNPDQFIVTATDEITGQATLTMGTRSPFTAVLEASQS